MSSMRRRADIDRCDAEAVAATRA